MFMGNDWNEILELLDIFLVFIDIFLMCFGGGCFRVLVDLFWNGNIWLSLDLIENFFDVVRVVDEVLFVKF